MNKQQPNTDQYLLSELKNGKEKAFDFLFRKYYKALCAQANSYVKDLDLAQSLVQDCFIKLWEKREEAESIDKISSYLSFMVRNKCIDFLRKQRFEETINEDKSISDDNRLSDSPIISKEFEEQLIIALEELPPRCKEAFEYSRFEGLTYSEIAIKMGVSEKAIEALLSRSLKILRHELKDYLPILILLYKINH